jgi:cytochrome c5
MASNISDQQFTKSFIIFVVLGVVLTLFLVFLGNLNAGTITDRVRGERNEMAQSVSGSNSLQPVGQISVGQQPEPASQTTQVAAATPTIDGASVYQSACMACHAAGVAGAPKMGNADVWSDRIAQGTETLYSRAIGGFQGKSGMMPPKGGNMALSDDEVKAAVDHMIAQSQ